MFIYIIMTIKIPIKQKVRKTAEDLFSFVGLDVFIRSKSKLYDWVLFDKNMLSKFYNHEDGLKLYYEGLNKSNGQRTDNFSKVCRFLYLPQYVEQVIKNKVEGDFVECGCWHGHSAYMISKLLKKYKFKNNFHIFDSFEGGLSDKTEEDCNERIKQSKKDEQIEKMLFSSRIEKVGHVLDEFKFVHLHNGWIPDVFKKGNTLEKIAFLHMDVDLYEPTLHSLEYFYPKISQGGCIAVDDYGVASFPGAKKAVDAFLSKNKHTFFLVHPLGACLIIK